MNFYQKQTKILGYLKYFFFFIILCDLLLTGCTTNFEFNGSSVYQKSITAFDTVISFTVYSKKDEAYLSEAIDMCNYYDNLLNRTKENSDIYKINHAGGNPTKVSKDTFIIIKEALNYSELTNGKVDITIAPVKDLWDFSNPNHEVISVPLPNEEILKEKLSHVNFSNIALDESNLTVTLKDSQAEIDLGFIAKGYIADKLKEQLKAKGVEHAIINLGGNVQVINNKPDGTPYKVAIKEPFTNNDYIKSIEIVDQSVVTSGIYERYVNINNKIYHHIIDTKTGYPAETDIISASIICSSSMKADALSTSCLLLGLDDATKLIENDEQASAYFITKDKEVIYIK